MKRERGSTIQRVLDILDTVAASPKPISATEINEVLNLPKATAHRLCSELEARGYLLKKINGKSYVPGNRLHDVAVGVLANSRLRATRHAILTSLSEKVGETCNIAYADGLYMAYSDRVEVIEKLQLVRRAKNTITDPETLIREIDKIEKREVSIDNQELYDDIIAIAVPIKDKQGRFYSSLAIQAPVSRISIDDSERYVPLLREAAHDLALLAEEDE
jgi:DNA-binding IclR family transcriptional regulator